MLGSTKQYLERYAEPEWRIAHAVPGRFRHVLVVPACGEAGAFWQGYERAARAASGPTLCIIVVNGRQDAPAPIHAQNAATLRELLAEARDVVRLSESPPAWLGRLGALDVLVVDRQRDGQRLPAKQGVGLARRIGADLALALHVSSKVESRFIANTDADVELPESYFATLETVNEAALAVAHPFTHVPGAEPSIHLATTLYEIRLRYYVLGLAHAGSPYAVHTVGSTLAVRADAYSAARGFPRREAAEDFYMLGKVAKLGPVASPRAEPIRITSRRSARVPFGTGHAVGLLDERLGTGADLTLYDPRSFDVLRAVHECIRVFAMQRSWARAAQELERAPLDRALRSTVLDEPELERMLVDASRQARDPVRLLRRAHVWFDAFKTLKLVHAVRNKAYPELHWCDALERAPFTSCAGEPTACLQCLTELETALPELIGPTALGTANE